MRGLRLSVARSLSAFLLCLAKESGIGARFSTVGSVRRLSCQSTLLEKIVRITCVYKQREQPASCADFSKQAELSKLSKVQRGSPVGCMVEVCKVPHV